MQVPIEQVPLGARIPTKNPKPWEYDDSLPDPVQADWAKISITMHRNDGGIVDAELLRPRWWIAQHNIIAGKHLPMNIEELQVHGSALVTSIEDCPEIAGGEGSVVTATFKTQEVHSIVRAEIRGPDGSIEIIEGTPIHPIWSVDRNDWVPLGELTEGESLQAADGLATVLSILVTNDSEPVYNIEVHGEHVYQAGELELLVHNGNLTCEMLGLDEAHYFVDGTIDLMDDTVFVYVRQLKKLDDAKGQGFAIWGVTRNLLNSAKNLGGRAIYGEAHVKEVTGRLEALLLRQGWRGTNDGFKIFLMKDL